MTLRRHLKPCSGAALRHIPANSPYDVLDVRFAGRGADNRWNEPGSPTLYLAADEGVLIAERGRHFDVDRAPALQALTVQRSIYRLELSLDAVLDPRDEVVCHALSLDDAPACFLDRELARATAHSVRRTTDAQALLVPSMGFLDDRARWRLAMFLEKLPPDPKGFIASVTPYGELRRG